jgi:hypothetical protein
MIRPCRFYGDPWGYAGNQCGHGVMACAVAVLLFGAAWWWAAPLSAALYLVAVEVLPGQVKRDPIDSFDDMAHAWFGAALVPAIGLSFAGGAWTGDLTAMGVLVVWGVYLVGQVRRRV